MGRIGPGAVLTRVVVDPGGFSLTWGGSDPPWVGFDRAGWVNDDLGRF
jgi:hypothetical protein